MTEVAQLILAILGAIIVWTTSVIGGMIWLTGKFRGLEKTVYREGAKHIAILNAQHIRIQRLEIKAFGFTGGNGVVIPDDGKTFPSGE